MDQNILDFICKEFSLQKHPDPYLSEYVFIPNNFTCVRALDGENFFFKNKDKEWSKSDCFVNKIRWTTIDEYINNFCCIENIYLPIYKEKIKNYQPKIAYLKLIIYK